MNIKERIIALRIIKKNEYFAKFLEEVGVSATMKVYNAKSKNKK